MSTESRHLDLLLAAVTLVAVPTVLVLTGGSTDLALTLPLAAWLALLTLVVRRWPVPTLLLAICTMFAWRSSELITVGWAWPATAIFAVVMFTGRVRWAVGTAAGYLLYAAVYDWTVFHRSAEWVVGRVGAETLWLAAVLAAVGAYHDRRRWQDEVAARLRQSLRENDLDAARRQAQERVRIAHELHDVVSHTLAVVGVHLNVALDAFDADPDEARGALRLAQDVRGRAMVDLKALVGVLRDDSGGGIQSPVAQLHGHPRQIEQVRSAGITITLDCVGDPSAVPAPVAAAVYRVVQESLTNTVRHAHANRICVTVGYGPAQVTVGVTDNGAATVISAGGHGIAGMRERVHALGGEFTAGPGDDGGFTVRATIPMAG